MKHEFYGQSSDISWYIPMVQVWLAFIKEMFRFAFSNKKEI